MGSYISRQDLRDLGYDKENLDGWDVLWCALGSVVMVTGFYIYHNVYIF